MKSYPEQIERAVGLLLEARDNSREMRIWKNVALATRVLELLDRLPGRGPAHSPYDKVFLLERLLDNLPCPDVPRLAVSVLEREASLMEAVEEADLEGYDCPVSADEVLSRLAMWRDYVDVDRVSDEVWLKSYGRHLRFDHIERTALWEEVYCDVEAEVERELDPSVPRGMGFCHLYWSVKRSVLERRGICWRSPSEMNPGVMFD